MTWKEIYRTTVKVLCEQPIEDFDTFITLEEPEIVKDGKVYFEEGHEGELSSMRLHEEIATDDDYKEFCEYMYNYVGDDLYNYLDKSEIRVFGKKFEY